MKVADVLRIAARILDIRAAARAPLPRCRACNDEMEPNYDDVDGLGTATHPPSKVCPVSGLHVPLTECKRGP